MILFLAYKSTCHQFWLRTHLEYLFTNTSKGRRKSKPIINNTLIISIHACCLLLHWQVFAAENLRRNINNDGAPYLKSATPAFHHVMWSVLFLLPTLLISHSLNALIFSFCVCLLCNNSTKWYLWRTHVKISCDMIEGLILFFYS